MRAYTVWVNLHSGGYAPHPFTFESDAKHYLAEIQGQGYSGSIIAT